MPKQKLKILVPMLPLLAMAALALIHTGLMLAFFDCKGTGCDSIPANLSRIFVPNDSNSRGDEKQIREEAWTKGTPETAKQLKEAKMTRNAASEAEVAALKYTGRLTSSFLGMAYLFVCLVALGVGCAVFYASIDRKNSLYILWVLAAGAMLVIGWFVFYRHPELHMPVVNELGPKTINTDVPGITSDVNRLNSFGYVVGIFMSLTVCAILAPFHGRGASTLKELSKRMKHLSSILYVSTLILVVGLLLEKAILQWSLAFISRDEHVVKGAENFTAGLLAFDGGYYTLLLAALYFPAAFLLRYRAGQIADDNPETLKKYGLNFSFAESLPRMVAILGPLLAGPIGELFGRMAK